MNISLLKYIFLYIIIYIIYIILVIYFYKKYKFRTETFQDKNKIIVTCFAGREYNMVILTKYLDKLIEKNKIHEIHIWDYTRDPADTKYVDTLKNKYTLIYPTNKKNWNEYYEYYKKNTHDNDIIIKLDDDILYIDVDNFDGFIEERRKNNCLLLFPSIVNNGVCAWYQQKYNLLPESLHKFKYESFMGELIENGDLATKVHKYFLNNKDEFLLKSNNINDIINLPIGERFSINFFAIMGKDFKKINITMDDDEHDITVNNTNILNMHNSIYMKFVVAHGAFKFQRDTGMNEKDICSLYLNLL